MAFESAILEQAPTTFTFWEWGGKRSIHNIRHTYLLLLLLLLLLIASNRLFNSNVVLANTCNHEVGALSKVADILEKLNERASVYRQC
jgi:hypothetical protein